MEFQPRDVVVTIKVRRTLKKVIRERARRDGRSVSSFLNFFLERALADQPEAQQQ